MPNTDPGLEPLADNGGPTKTHMLQEGSPAVDPSPLFLAGIERPIACSYADQRGRLRVDGKFGSTCDIGAVDIIKRLAEISGPSRFYNLQNHKRLRMH